MKQLFDLFPLAIFAGVFFLTKDMIQATAALIVASAIQLIVDYARRRTVQKTHLYTFLILLVFGGLTIFLRDETFIKWKPTVVYWIFSLVFLGSQFIGKKLMVQRMVEGMLSQAPHLSLTMPDSKWMPLNACWVLFFVGLGFINLFVAFSFSEEVWVTFKLVGLTVIMLVFLIAQFVYLSRFMVEVDAKESTADSVDSNETKD